MLTCASRAEAVQIFYKLRDLGGVTPAVVITPNSGREGDDENNTPQTEKIIGEFFRKVSFHVYVGFLLFLLQLKTSLNLW